MSTIDAPPPRSISLDDRYALHEGTAYLSGIQALVRVLLDQRAADDAAGLDTAAFVSGYQGSPLGTFDSELQRQRRRTAAARIVHEPGVNEELAATAVWGTQLLGSMPGRRRDGVLGVWYGKSPGVDRASDAIRHGNVVGTSPTGGVLALAGDDPAAKSSTMPGASEPILAALSVPVLQPGSVQEALDLGRHAIACSRASGLWAALKVVTRLVDATAVAEVGAARVAPLMPDADWPGGTAVHEPHAQLLGARLLELERTMLEVRLERAREYGRRNGLAVVTHDPPGARLGVAVAGTAYHDLLQVLADLGFAAPPVRILKLGMIFPLDEQAVRDAARGLDELLVIEEKGPFLERLVKDALYGTTDAPRVTGKRDERGDLLVPLGGMLDADRLLRPVAERIAAVVPDAAPRVREALARLDAGASAIAELPTVTQRTPFFCSGCPHNTSTQVPEGTVVGAGIGCHTLVLLNPAGRGELTGTTQMGGEGAQWIGLTHFLDPQPIVQNMGDGTFHHSGSLAIRAAVAAGTRLTYKLLYNDAVAMTGGQRVAGRMAIPDVVRLLLAEGVARIVVTAEDPSRYDEITLPAGVAVRPREQIQAVQEELAQVPGVTVLIHDQMCAIEKRRARRRGDLPAPARRVLINERVCEGCGDCGETSNCLSVEPVETEFGRKTRIHQSSCSQDFSCLKGDCPSFLTVIPPARDGADSGPRRPSVALPEPSRLVPDDARIRLVGIGGTGVVTVSQVLGVAAQIDGRHASGLDQTGLSQKGGPVVSDVHITDHAADGSVSAPAASVDALLVLDLLGGAAPANLATADPARTVAAVDVSVAPTGRMATVVDAPAPDTAAARAAIDARTRAADNVAVPGRALAQALFGDHMATNVLMLGAAWQQGAIPLSLAAIEQALRLNGVAVEQNLAAFAWGRAAVVAPELVAAELGRAPGSAGGKLGALPGRTPAAPLTAAERALVDMAAGGAAGAGGELRRLLEIRVPDLVAYQDLAYARRYAESVARVREAEERALGTAGDGSAPLAEAAAHGLHKLMAYKDEYEVARLHLDGLADVPAGSAVAVHLHPPALRALGLERKLPLRREVAVPLLEGLRRMKRVRGTRLDPFGRAEVRRVERALVAEYEDHVRAVCDALSPATRELALELLALPDVVRGYEQIKLANVARYRARAAELRTAIAAA